MKYAHVVFVALVASVVLLTVTDEVLAASFDGKTLGLSHWSKRGDLSGLDLVHDDTLPCKRDVSSGEVFSTALLGGARPFGGKGKQPLD